MAYGQRIRLEQPRGLLRQRARRLPRVVPPQVRHHRRAQPGVGHHLLGPGDERLRRSAHPTVHGRRLDGQPRPEARLRTVRQRHAPRLLQGRTRRDRRNLPRQAVHHELHGLHRPVLHGLRRLGRGSELRIQRPLLPRGRIPPRRAGLLRRAHGFARARQAVVRHGTLHLGGAVEAAQHPQAQGRDRA